MPEPGPERTPPDDTTRLTDEDRDRIGQQRIADIRRRCTCDRGVPAADFDPMPDCPIHGDWPAPVTAEDLAKIVRWTTDGEPNVKVGDQILDQGEMCTVEDVYVEGLGNGSSWMHVSLRDPRAANTGLPVHAAEFSGASLVAVRSARQAAGVERLRAELAEAKGAQEARQAHTGHVMHLLDETRKLVEETEAERDALKAAIAEVRRLQEMTIASSCRMHAIEQAEDTLAVLDRALAVPESTEAAPCPRCEGSMVEPGTEAEGDWDLAAMRHHPYTGEPCTACNGTGNAPEAATDAPKGGED